MDRAIPGLPVKDPKPVSCSELSAVFGASETEMTAHREPRRGDRCPGCRQSRLDYDGLLNLVCPHCGFMVGGCFT